MRYGLLLAALFVLAVYHPIAGDEKDDKRKMEEKAKRIEQLLRESDAMNENQPRSIARKKTNEEWKEFLSKAESMELYALNPDKEPKGQKEFHKCEIVTAVTLDKDQRREAGTYFGKTLHWNHGREAACFSPHHGLRVTAGKKTLDFVICYSCNRLAVYDEKGILDHGVVAEITPNVLDTILDKAKKKADNPPKP